MTLDGTYAGTVDRVDDGTAVLLVERDGETVAERHLPAAELPAGAGDGAVCSLTFEAGELVDVEYRPDSTAERRERAREKFDRLSKRLGEHQDDEDDEDDG